MHGSRNGSECHLLGFLFRQYCLVNIYEYENACYTAGPSYRSGTAPAMKAAISFFICSSEGRWMYIMWPDS